MNRSLGGIAEHQAQPAVTEQVGIIILKVMLGGGHYENARLEHHVAITVACATADIVNAVDTK